MLGNSHGYLLHGRLVSTRTVVCLQCTVDSAS